MLILTRVILCLCECSVAAHCNGIQSIRQLSSQTPPPPSVDPRWPHGLKAELQCAALGCRWLGGLMAAGLEASTDP